MFKRIATIFTIFVLGLFVTAVSADAAVSVRLQQPKSPNNQTSFNLTFVTLDTEGHSVTVKCFKKGPSDGAFSQFGSDIAVSGGGNTDNCVVNNAVVTGEGTYEFQVVANNNNGSGDVTSNTVSVDVKTGGPGTPGNYSKDKITACEYKVHFKTADDGGKTVKVEIYRSENKSFDANSGTRVGTINIGSNTNHDFIQSVPDCNKVYYYAVRAFDSAGNGSGVVGDSESVVTINTINPTTTTQQQAGAIPVAAANQESSVTSGSEAETTGEPSVSPAEGESDEANAVPADAEQGVQGASTSSMGSVTTWLTVVGVIILAIIVYLFVRRRFTK